MPAFAVALLLRILAAPAQPVGTPALLHEMFRASERVTYVELSAQEVTAATGQPHGKVFVYVAYTHGAVDGFAVIDDEKGLHEPITLGVQVDPQGRIARVAVLAYREAYGGEVRDPRFLKQFNGKTLASALTPGVDVDAISGATISSRSVATLARRALVLCALAQKRLGGGT